MTWFRYTPVLACVFALGCEQELTMRERVVEEQAVEERFQNLVRLMNNARVDSVLAFYDQSPALRVMWSDGTRAEGIEQVEQSLRDFYGKINYMNFVPQSPTIQVLNKDVALTSFRHSTDVVLAGGDRLPVSSGQGMIVWGKGDDGPWRVLSQIISVNSGSM